MTEEGMIRKAMRAERIRRDRERRARSVTLTREKRAAFAAGERQGNERLKFAAGEDLIDTAMKAAVLEVARGIARHLMGDEQFRSLVGLEARNLGPMLERVVRKALGRPEALWGDDAKADFFRGPEEAQVFIVRVRIPELSCNVPVAMPMKPVRARP